MKDIYRSRRVRSIPLTIAAIFVTVYAGASTGDFYPSYQAKILAHITLQGPPAQKMFVQREGRKDYLYVRQASQSSFTVFDVSKPKSPHVINRGMKNLVLVDSGIAISESPDQVSAPNLASPASAGATNVPEQVRVLDVSDPAHPRTIQKFDDVTSMVRDDARNLIYVANGDGIWVLSHQRVLRRHLCSSSDAISSAMPNCD